VTVQSIALGCECESIRLYVMGNSAGSDFRLYTVGNNVGYFAPREYGAESGSMPFAIFRLYAEGNRLHTMCISAAADTRGNSSP
jgi:hypothetical protein